MTVTRRDLTVSAHDLKIITKLFDSFQAKTKRVQFSDYKAMPWRNRSVAKPSLTASKRSNYVHRAMMSKLTL